MSDYLMRMIDHIGEMARNIFDRNEDNDIHMTSESSASLETLTSHLLDLLEQEKYNEGENVLFSYAEKDNSAYVLYAGKMFYSRLAELSADDLLRGGFSREEIYQGLRDFSHYFEKSPDSGDMDSGAV